MTSRAFPFTPGESPKIAAAKVEKCVQTLAALGYRTAILDRDFVPGTFAVNVDPAKGFTVHFKPLSGLAPMPA
jgi:hypothetical protein